MVLDKKYQSEKKRILDEVNRIIYKNNILKFCEYTEYDNIKEIIILGCYRIKKENNTIYMYEKDIIDGKWIIVPAKRKKYNYNFFYDFIFFPVGIHGKRHIINMVIDKLLSIYEINSCFGKSFYKEISKNIYSKYFYRISKNHEYGFMFFKKKLWGDILDREILKLISAIKFNQTISDHAFFSQNFDGFMKVAREHKNLTPLLFCIKPEYWTYDNLFSRKLWVKNGRKTTKLSRDIKSVKKLNPFEESRAWNFMRTAPISLIRVISEKICKNFDGMKLVDILSRCSLNTNSYIIAYSVVAKKISPIRYNNIHIHRVLSAFFFYCDKITKKNKYKDAYRIIDFESEKLPDIFDFLDENPDFVMHKNMSWERLNYKCTYWHQSFMHIIEDMYEWEDALGEIKINNCTFIPLTSSESLMDEGEKMNHCVMSYNEMCSRGLYRVFSVFDGKEYSTLGIHIDGKSISFDQHKGVYNSEPSTNSKLAIKEFMRIYENKMAVK